MTHTLLRTAHSPIAFVSSGVYTEPVGLLGDTNTRAFVRGVSAVSSWATVTLKSVDSSVSRMTGLPPASSIASGYVVQYGAGRMTSSPGSHMAQNAT